MTGKIYHLMYAPPETPEIAARLTQRLDDTEEKVGFVEHEMPLSTSAKACTLNFLHESRSTWITLYDLVFTAGCPASLE